MKNVILKVPTFVFVGLVLAPLVFIYFGYVEMSNTTAVFALVFGAFVSYISWGVSLTVYMSEEANTNKFLVPCISLFVVYGCFELALVSGFFNMSRLVLVLLSTVVSLANATLMTMLIKKVFYARSTWYLFLEMWIYPIGMLSLTPEVKKWEAGGKNEKEESDVLDD